MFDFNDSPVTFNVGIVIAFLIWSMIQRTMVLLPRRMGEVIVMLSTMSVGSRFDSLGE